MISFWIIIHTSDTLYLRYPSVILKILFIFVILFFQIISQLKVTYEKQIQNFDHFLCFYDQIKTGCIVVLQTKAIFLVEFYEKIQYIKTRP